METLDRRGVLNEVRGRLRAEVFKALDDEAAPKPKLSNENVLINELIREYLIYNKYRYSEMTLRSGNAMSDISSSFPRCHHISMCGTNPILRHHHEFNIRFHGLNCSRIRLRRSTSK
mgnify:CR=1 FL=1